MVRNMRNPWAKKSRRGMKTIKTMAKVGGALGAASYVGLGNANKQARPTCANTKTISPTGCCVVVVAIILGAIIGVCTESYLTFLLISCGTLFIVSIITFASPERNEMKKAPTPVMPDNEKQNEWGIEFEETTHAVMGLIVDMASDVVITSRLESLPANQREECCLQALLSALDEYNLMSEMPREVENYIDSLAAKMQISENTLAGKKQYIEFMKSLTVQDVLHGITPHRASLTSNPLNFQKGEALIWPFIGVVLYEEVVSRQSYGASRGISVRIARGIYYRVGAFKGEPLITTNLKPKYTGSLVITNKNIYFYSSQKSMRMPYNKIISFVPFEDGIGVQLDKMNAKTVYIKGLDGRFAFNIVSNIQNIEN